MNISIHFPSAFRQRMNDHMNLPKLAVKNQIYYIRAIKRVHRVS
jgi:hypothetical protein